MSNNNSVGNFTRGSQVITHQMRMFAQGVRSSFVMGLGCVVVWVIWHVWSDLTLSDLYHTIVSEWASFKLSFFTLFRGNKAYQTTDISFYHFGMHRWFKLKAYSYLHWEYARQAVEQTKSIFDFYFSLHFLRQLICAFVTGIALSIGIFMYKGWKKHQKKVERGGLLTTPSKLTHLLKGKKEDSDIVFDNLPLVKNSENLHLLFSGTTGSGKTNALYKLLPQIRAKGQKAVIVDLNGSFVSKYYREGKDIILNPLDERTSHWSPWADCLSKAHYDAFSEALIPQEGLHADKFWENAARTVLSATLEKLDHSQKTSELCQILLGTPIHELEQFLQGTAATFLVSSQGERMSASIVASMTHYIKGLLYVQDTENPFSIRRWMTQEDDSWLFLTAAPDQRATLRPLLTSWLDVSFNALMAQGENRDRRVWFILDELPALQKIPSLQTALAESRKFGGSVVAGIQNMNQLQKVYGHAESQSLMNLFNTSFIFRTEDPQTCSYLANKLGEQEISDVKENISYGANTIRDGVSLNSYEKRHLLVLPTEISTLPNLECYIKYPGSWAITRLKMKIEKPSSISSSFLLKEIKTTIKYIPQPQAGKLDATISKQNDLFDEKKEKDIRPDQQNESISVI